MLNLKFAAHFLLDKCFAHGSAPCSVGKGRFLGALTMVRFCEAGFAVGGALTGRLPDDAEDEARGLWTGCGATGHPAAHG